MKVFSYIIKKNPSCYFSTKISVLAISCWFVSNLGRNGYECLSYMIACHSLLLKPCSIWKMCLAPCSLTNQKTIHFYSCGLFTVISKICYCASSLLEKVNVGTQQTPLHRSLGNICTTFQLMTKINSKHTSCAFDLNILFRMYLNSYTLALF